MSEEESLGEQLRAELLRQKIVFESELRRQREHFEEKLDEAFALLKERENDCRNLQTALTTLGRKIDSMDKGVGGVNSTESPPRKDNPRFSSPGSANQRPDSQRTSSPVIRRPSPTPSTTTSRGASPTTRAQAIRKPSPTPLRSIGVPANIKAALNSSVASSKSSAVADSNAAVGLPRNPPFLASPIIPPSGAQTTVPTGADLPHAKLELTRVYGVGSLQSNAPAVLASVGAKSECVLYSAGSICAVLKPNSNLPPMYYYGHTDSVTAIAVHPGDTKFRPKTLVATSQYGRKPHICIWDIESGTTVATLRDFHEKTVLALSFSANGEHLASVSGDTQHTLNIFLWQTKELISTAKISTEQFSSMAYHPYDPRVLVTVCSHHLKLWEMQFPGKGHALKLVPRTGLVPPTPGKSTPRTTGFKSIAFLDAKNTIVGSLEGSLYLWRGADLASVIESVHPGGVTAATDVPNSDVVLTSGYDGNVHIWRRSAFLSDVGGMFAPLRTVHVKEFAESTRPYHLSSLLNIAVSEPHDGVVSLFAVSNGNFICQLTINPNVDAPAGQCSVLTATHGKCTGTPVVVCHPNTSSMFVGVGTQLHTLDLTTGKLLRSVQLTSAITAMCLHASGTSLLVARAPKTLSIHDTSTLLETASYPDVTPPDVTLMRVSPAGYLLAVVGAKETSVDVLDIANSYKRLGRTKHTGYITHLDWSNDGEIFQTCDATKQLSYFRKDCTKVADPRSCADIVFQPFTCKYGWGVQGIWEENAQPDDINVVKTTKDGRLCYVGDNKGNLKVFLYPSASKFSSHRLYRGQEPAVKSLEFSFDESVLVSASANGCIYQWSVTHAPVTLVTE
eukprot:PhF_6_TR40461/c0_g1_i1/m.60460/K18598/EML6; echinoderm microtubule-associated protein-like 6